MLKYFKKCALATLLLSSGLSATQPYDSVRLLSRDPYYIENGYILVDKVNNSGSNLFVDVDSPNGDVSRFIASTNSSVTVFSVNSWDGEDQYHRFLSNVNQDGISDRVIALRMSSADASNALDLNAGVIYIDSSHSDTLHDKILMWLTHLNNNGVIAGNDWQVPAVEVAVVNASSQLNLVLTVNNNFWFLTRP